MPARISVVLPVFNVRSYLPASLGSLARQTVGDQLEVVVVDDGSTDGSGEIAEAFAARDSRFRVFRQENAGLGAARNAGVERASGEFLIFADSDDVVPRHAYEMLVATLDRSGSDFASGNVRRLTPWGTTQASFVWRTFTAPRLGTHVTRFPALITDRVAWNKLFRRSFWDRHGLRFPEGVLYEDIPVMVPAHYLATAVDIVSEAVYLWRIRPGVDASITQRRTETRAIRDRIAAVDHVSRFLAGRGLVADKLRYDTSVLGDDLRLFLTVLDRAEPADRELFVRLANDFLDRADPRVLDQPLAIDRLMWQLVRRRALPELMEVLRFVDDDLAVSLPVRRGRGLYGDYPYRDDERLAIPSEVYELDAELEPEARLNDVRWEGTQLVLDGYAYIPKIGAPEPGSQGLEVDLQLPGRGWRVARFRTEAVRRRDVTAESEELVSLDWSGFRATIDLDRHRLARGLAAVRAARRRGTTFEIAIVVSAGGITRKTSRVEFAPFRPHGWAETEVGGVFFRAGPGADGKLTLRAGQRAAVHSCAVEEGALRLRGDAGHAAGGTATLTVRRRVGTTALEYPVSVDSDEHTFVGVVPLVDLLAEIDPTEPAASREQAEGIDWELYLTAGQRGRRLRLDESAEQSIWIDADREVALTRTQYGFASLIERSFRPVLSQVEWAEDGALALTGSFQAPAGEYDLLLGAGRGRELRVVAPLRRTGSAFTAAFAPGALVSLAGRHQLPQGDWELLVRHRDADGAPPARMVLHPELHSRLPIRARFGHKVCNLGVDRHQAPVVHVEHDLDEEERGGYRQRLLRASFYPRRRSEPVENVVLYLSYGGRAFSDSPRAIHAELVRRDAPFEHRWVVRDGAFRVPESAIAVRELGREYYESFARARYVVTNDHWPHWVERRPDQIWIQTWHGFPVKKHGFQLADRPAAVRAYRQAARERAQNWHYVVSPSRAATSLLEDAFPPAAELVEAGLPRTDLLVGSNGDEAVSGLRARLGLDPNRRVVLYAPTYRDSLVCRDGYQLGPLLDLDEVKATLGDEWTILFRKHRLAVGRLPAEFDALAVDVSDFPDGTELLQIADVLVTDYSSALLDFLSTTRPVILYAPDLDDYRDRIRGLNVDLEAEAPGPLLRTTGEVVDALRDPEGLLDRWRHRHEAFKATYGPLNDGQAAARVVERIFADA